MMEPEAPAYRARAGNADVGAVDHVGADADGERIDVPSALVETVEGEDGWQLNCRPGDSAEGTRTYVPGAGPDGPRVAVGAGAPH